MKIELGILDILTHLDKELQTETLINLLVEEAITTSEIEGEHLKRPDVRSSIKNKLGLNLKPLPVRDRRAQGIVDLIFDVRDTFNQELTESKLFDWHLMLLGGSYNPNLRVGYWRTEEDPMEIVSTWKMAGSLCYPAIKTSTKRNGKISTLV